MKQKWKRPLALLLSVAMMFSISGIPVYAADVETGTSVCPHHVHDETCGYSEGTPCTHEHTDDCYTLVPQCVHEHTAECYSDGMLPAEGEEKAADACTHVCSEESGCITKELNCPHVHDETCGYSEGSPCTFDAADCELCNPTDSGEPEAPAECTCETLCTEGSINPDCPVCGAEGADLTACAGTVEEGDAAEETDPAQNPAEQTILSWEWIGADNLNEGVLALPGVSAETPVDLDAVVSMLPTGVTATVDGSADPVELTLTWSCGDFPAQATQGEYTFTAALPEGYTLGEETAAPTVAVVLGGGTTLEITPSQPAGNGISGDPYRITNAAELLWFAQAVNNGSNSAWATLQNDIDLSGAAWAPITTYNGTFDGQGHTIDNLVLELTTDSTGDTYAGFVGELSGTIQNLTLGEGCRIAAVSTASFGQLYTGGICGENSGTIQNCINRGTVTVTAPTPFAGGICGYNNVGTIQNCANTGNINVTGTFMTRAGGILGYCNSSTIEGCFNTGMVSASASGWCYAGGICGESGTAITNCYWQEGTADKGIGSGTGDTESKPADDFASGAVCYLLNNSVSSDDNIWRQNLGEGGDPLPVLDSSHGIVYAQLNCTGGLFGVYGNSEFMETPHSPENGICTVCESYYEPAEKNSDGVYQIENAGNLFWFAALVNGTLTDGTAQNKSANVVLMNDITIPDGYIWTPIGNGSIVYTGTFDGQGHTISGMTIENAASYSGLFGNSEGTIKSFTLTGSITVTTNDVRSVAGVAGYMKNTQNAGGTISDVVCGVDITVTATNTHHIGGIVGSLGQSSSGMAMVERCLYTGTLTTSESVDCQGGIAGYAQTAAIRDCGNQGDVTGTGKESPLGGILGYCNSSDVSVTNCYNTGSVVKSDGTGQGTIIGMNNNDRAAVSNCYWLEGTADKGIGSGTDNTVSKPADDFASGAVCYLLNNSVSGDDNIWRQNLGEDGDDAPVPDSTHGVVYAQYFCDGKTLTGYYANNNDFPETIHNFDKDGFCNFGDHYQPAEQDGEGVYQITNAGQLFWFAALVNGDTTYAEFDAQDTAAKAVLMKDIIIPEGRNWTPIGNYSTSDSLKYTGAFDGDGHTIQGMVVNNPNSDYQGLVGYLGEGGTIKDLTMGETCSVTGNKYVGGVCGEINSGTIQNCTNNGTVTGSGDDVGGICGYSCYGSIETCTNSGTVTGSSDNVGGICGYNENGTLQNSTNEGNVKGYSDNVGGICGYSQGGSIQNCTNNGTAEISGSMEYYLGGICGQNNGGAIANCTNSGTIITSSSYAGGICGGNYSGTIASCTNNGAVTAGGSYVGGICGQNYSGTIETSYNCGDVDGGGSAGGVCGENSGGIQDCYNAGGIAGGSSVGGVCGRNVGGIQSCYNAGGITGSGYVGSVCGFNTSSIANCYWLDSTCTIGVGYGGGSATVKTAPQFASGEVTWLLNGSTSEGTLVWFQNLGEGGDDFPLLDNTHGVVYSLDGGYANEDHEHSYTDRGFCQICGAYQPADLKDGVYQITNAGNLFWFAARVNGDGNVQNAAANAALTADIDLSGLNMGAIGSEATPYTGTFDGAGHTIDGLRLQGAGDSWGFVRCLGEGGKIQNLTMGANCSVTASGSYVGVFCGQNNGGTLTGCTNRGTVNGSSNMGGICGRNEGTMENCANTGSVTGGGSGGGLCGSNAGTMKNCNNTGSVTGSGDYAGGICGRNTGILQNSTNFGAVAGYYGVGGICGNNNTGTIQNCANTGTVTVSGDGYAGGVCGINSSEAFLANCYNTGTVTGVSPVGGLCALNRGTLSNCYWLDTACGNGIFNDFGISTKAESKTADEFASGEVVYLLNGSTSTGTLTWFQNLGEGGDTLPVLDGSHSIVYPIGDLYCDGTVKGDIRGYSNDPGATGTRDDHAFGGDGFCTACGQYQPAEQNEGGVYEISNAGQLFWFGAMVNGDSSKADFEEQDLSAGAVLTSDITIPEGHNWTAMGNYYRPYTGTFDGADHTIEGLKLESTFNHQGLVGCLDKDGKIQNLTMGASCSVSSSSFVGVLCGYNAGTIQNCTNNGAATATVTYSGGICGVNFGGTVKGCTNTGKVSGRNDTGGICGNNSSTVENCHNTGEVSGGSYVSGICGYSNGTVKGCTNAGAVTGSGNYVGGVCGHNIGANATLSGCTNSGAVTGSGNYVGGLCGCNETGYLINCYTTGAVSGGSDVGGVCGHNNIGTVANCYTTGTVSGSSNVGGVCGVNEGALRNCYWLDTAYQGGGIGSGTATDVAAKSADEFASGEVAYLLNDSTSTGTLTWFQNLDNSQPTDDFPLLDSTHGTVYPIGDTHCDGTFKEGEDAGYTNDPDKAGTQDDHTFDGDGFCTFCDRYQPAILNGGVYEISNAGQLFWFAALVNGDTSQEGITASTTNASAVLTTDITIPAGRSWTAIGDYSRPYTGTFDGAGHTIEGLILNNQEDRQGFVGRLGQSGVLQNLTLGESCSLTGNRLVGGLCGYNDGTIAGCINMAAVHENGGQAGGICGNNNGTIQNCANIGPVKSYYSIVGASTGVGGICGRNLGIIRNCYNTGRCSAISYVGGICGWNDRTIQNCYWSSDATYLGVGTGGSGGAISKTIAQFASGEVAWLLNGSTSTGTLAWYQNLDNGQTPDTSPVLDSSHGTVYEIDSSLKLYSNDPTAVPPVTEVTITWGALSYTYSESTWNAATHSYEGAGWTTDTENENAVKVENTGNTAVSVSYDYTAVESGITGSFTDGETPVSEPVSLPENGSSTVYLILAGKPEQNLDHAKIGSVTVTIGGESE